MTKLLEEVLVQVNQLPDTEQDQIAYLIRASLPIELTEPDDEAEARWNASFAKSQDGLSKLAAEALSDYRAGRTTALDL